MALVTKETISGELVFATAGQRTIARNRITTYLNRQQVLVESQPSMLDQDTSKYGNGPTLLLRVNFVTRADADEVWADVEARSFSILQDGSALWQYTSNEDPAIGLNEAIMHHVRHWPAQPSDF